MIILVGKIRQAGLINRKLFKENKDDPDRHEEQLKVIVEHEAPNKDNPDFMEIELKTFWLPSEQQPLCPAKGSECQLMVKPWTRRDSGDVGLSALGFVPNANKAK